jgi:hypothetical protein
VLLAEIPHRGCKRLVEPHRSAIRDRCLLGAQRECRTIS